MNVAKENAKTVGVQIRLEVFVVFARLVSIFRPMVVNVPTTMNVKRLECVQTACALIWTAASSVVAILVINCPHLAMLASTSTNVTKILEYVLTDVAITLRVLILALAYPDLLNRATRPSALIWTNAPIQVPYSIFLH